MRRYLSVSKRRSVGHSIDLEKVPELDSVSSADGHASTTALMTPTVPLPPPNLKVKRLDYYYSRWSKSWKYKDMGDKVAPEAPPVGASSANDAWQAYCFVVVRTLSRKEDEPPTFRVVIKSQYMRQACKDVIKDVPGISWNADPLQLTPELLITFLPRFEQHLRELQHKKEHSKEESYIMSSIDVMVQWLHKDYKVSISTFRKLISHGEITFELLYALLVPRSTLITKCPVTGEPRALELVNASKIKTMTGYFYELLCESVDAVEEGANPNANDGWATPMEHSVDVEVRKAKSGRSFGRIQSRIIIAPFPGTIPINTLDAYPIQHHENEEEVRQTLLARGRKWESLNGIHHMYYKGVGSFASTTNGCKKYVKYIVNSRIMVDRTNFKRLNPNYEFPTVKRNVGNGVCMPTPLPPDHYTPVPIPPSTNGVVHLPPALPDQDLNRAIPTLHVGTSSQHELAPKLTEDELILSSPTVYGFSLADKLWLEFNVANVSPIVWNDEAFKNLVLPAGRKTLLQSLVEAHNADVEFDDFVQGKGHGLVINLFGPPGVGKTLSAEATSEHVRSPLYVVGGGDIGTNAAELDTTLQRTFDIATSWKAIILIDEADVFLEQRSLHDLERNAMVAVFLRHIEYYRGILFLTTNRVKTFDEAFLSRIHVALHFQELSKEAKVQVWRAFLTKVGVQIGGETFKEEMLQSLAGRNINGRQIKNATRTASSLAASRKEKLGFRHLMDTLDAMDEFTAEFRAMNQT